MHLVQLDHQRAGKAVERDLLRGRSLQPGAARDHFGAGVEQDADLVMLLSKESATDEPDNSSPSEDGEAQPMAANVRGFPCKLNIAKQRNGPTDRIRLLFQPRFTRFDSLPREAR